MKQAIDPQAILEVIQKNTTHTLNEDLVPKSEQK